MNQHPSSPEDVIPSNGIQIKSLTPEIWENKIPEWLKAALMTTPEQMSQMAEQRRQEDVKSWRALQSRPLDSLINILVFKMGTNTDPIARVTELIHDYVTENKQERACFRLVGTEDMYEPLIITEEEVRNRLHCLFPDICPDRTLRYHVHNIPMTSSDSEEILLQMLPLKRKKTREEKKEGRLRRMEFKLGMRFRNRDTDISRRKQKSEEQVLEEKEDEDHELLPDSETTLPSQQEVSTHSAVQVSSDLETPLPPPFDPDSHLYPPEEGVWFRTTITEDELVTSMLDNKPLGWLLLPANDRAQLNIGSPVDRSLLPPQHAFSDMRKYRVRPNMTLPYSARNFLKGLYPEYNFLEDMLRSSWKEGQQSDWSFEIQDSWKQGQRTAEDRKREWNDNFEVHERGMKFAFGTAGTDMEENTTQDDASPKMVKMVIPKGKLFRRRNSRTFYLGERIRDVPRH